MNPESLICDVFKHILTLPLLFVALWIIYLLFPLSSALLSLCAVAFTISQESPNSIC